MNGNNGWGPPPGWTQQAAPPPQQAAPQQGGWQPQAQPWQQPQQMQLPQNPNPQGGWQQPPVGPPPAGPNGFGGPAAGYGSPNGYGGPNGGPGYASAGGSASSDARAFLANVRLNSGEQTRRLPFLIDGTYRLSLFACRFKRTRKDKALYIIEIDVLESNVPQRPAGTRCSAFIDFSNMDMRGKHIAAFVAALYGYDPQRVPPNSDFAPWEDPQTRQHMDWMYYVDQSLDESNPWQGREIGCHVETVSTRSGRPFTAHNWLPAEGLVIPEVVIDATPKQAWQPPAAAAAPPAQGGWQPPPPAAQGWQPPAGAAAEGWQPPPPAAQPPQQWSPQAPPQASNQQWAPQQQAAPPQQAPQQQWAPQAPPQQAPQQQPWPPQAAPAEAAPPQQAPGSWGQPGNWGG